MAHITCSIPMYQDREDLLDETIYSDEEMGELSDSLSSAPSLSRPVTPHGQLGTSPPSEPYTLALKAEKILGLTPGTLPHALACLENARDEVRRCNSTSPPLPIIVRSSMDSADSLAPSFGSQGVRGRFDRARKVMSMAMPGQQAHNNGGLGVVVVGTGGKDEEELREKRRRAADGVLYWQREVARLEQVEAKDSSSTTKKRRR